MLHSRFFMRFILIDSLTIRAESYEIILGYSKEQNNSYSALISWTFKNTFAHQLKLSNRDLE